MALGRVLVKYSNGLLCHLPSKLPVVLTRYLLYLLGILNHCGDAVRLSSLAAPQLSPRSFAIAADGCPAVKSL
jgi:hypothetical protein